MHRTHRLIALLTAGLSFAAPALSATPTIDPANPPTGRFADDWMEVYLLGQKIGYGHSTMTRAGDQITTASSMVLRLGRAGKPVEITVDQNVVETLAGQPRSFKTVMHLAKENFVTRGEVKDGQVTVTAEQFGIASSQTLPYPKGALMAWGSFCESLRRGFEPGTEYTILAYAPELRLDAGVPTTLRVGQRETFQVGKRTLSGIKVTATVEAPVGSYTMDNWVTEEGTVVKASVSMPGIGDLVLITTDEQAALADFVTPELFMETTISVQPIDRDAAQQITYRVRVKDDPEELANLPTTGMQRVTQREGDTAELVVTRQAWPSGKARQTGSKAPPPELQEYLDSNLLMNLDDPELKALAQRVSAEGKTRYELADELRRFVTSYIKHKNLDIGFATASEVCRTRQGDCSEHGVLLAALGRLHGFPSRVVVGLAYVPIFGNRDHIFGYHMWTEYWIDGRWYNVDAALRETNCSPARIAFATSSLKNAGLADLSLPLIRKIGAIELEVVAVQSLDTRPTTEGD